MPVFSLLLFPAFHMPAISPDMCSSGNAVTFEDAQPSGNAVTFEDAVLAITGCDDISQVSDEVIERFEQLSCNPLRINVSSRGALQSSGLFSHYQIESLLDYIERNGPVLSRAELSAVDGFSAMAASYLALFVSFEEGLPLRKGFESETSGGISGKLSDGAYQCRAGMKFSGTVFTGKGGFVLGAAARTPWASPFAPPENFAWHMGWRRQVSPGRFALTEFTAGWYNARFAQGLCCWSGTVIESYASASSLMKRPQGITAYSGYAPTGTKFGAACSVQGRHFSLSPFVNFGPSFQYALLSGKLQENVQDALKDVETGMNLSWTHRSGTVGFTCLVCPHPKAAGERVALSADFQQTLYGTVLFGECCLKSRSIPSAVLGVRRSSEHFDTALRCSFLPQEHNCSLSSTYLSRSGSHSAALALSGSYYSVEKGHTPKGACQLKIFGNYRCSFLSKVSLTTRITCRLRSLTVFSDPDAPYALTWNGVKTDFRQDVEVNLDPWHLCFRFNALHFTGHSMLGYVECGYKSRSGLFQSYFRSGAFKIDCWDDRIYVYQRDAPGSFNITAKYGRGVWSSIYVCLKVSRRVKLHLMTSFDAYPWARPEDTRKSSSLAVNFLSCINLASGRLN